MIKHCNALTAHGFAISSNGLAYVPYHIASFSSKTCPVQCEIILAGEVQIITKNTTVIRQIGQGYRRYERVGLGGISQKAEKGDISLRRIANLPIRACIGIFEGDIGDDSLVYCHLESWKRGSSRVVIRAVQESRFDQVNRVCRDWQGVTVLGARVREISQGIEFREVWNVGGNGCVYSSCDIRSIRHPCYPRVCVHRTGRCGSTVNMESSQWRRC